MYSEKAYHIADNCRFCWMCRHVCPVGLKTGKEINTPRAKGLLVSMEKRGFEMEKDSAEAFYECMLCGSCSNDCATGFEPPVFIREARTRAAAAGLLPEAVERVLDRVLDTGVMYEECEEPKALSEKINDHQKKAKLLLLLGATARIRRPEMALALMRLLEKAEVDFMVLEKEPGTGSELYDLIGAVEETREQAAACSRQLCDTGAEKIVVLDSYLAETLKHEYPLWDCALESEILTATSFVAGLIDEGRLHPEALSLSVTIHDSPRLARDLKETEPVRDILKASVCEIKEMFLNRELTRCCGSSLFAEYAPKLALLTGQGRLEDAKRTGAGILVVECPQALDVLKMAAERTKTGEAGADCAIAETESGNRERPEILDIFSLLLKAVEENGNA